MSLTKLLRSQAGYSLSRAKACTDAVLDNQPVIVEFPEDQYAHVAKELNEIGFKFSEK